jgi:Icc-related predicted phosphoesterase
MPVYETKSIHTFPRNPSSSHTSTCKVIAVYNVYREIYYEIDASYTEKIGPKPEGTMRIVCISDTHESFFKKIPDGDVLIHAGDFTYTGEEARVKEFNNWLGEQPHKHKIVIAGNHEITFEKEYYNKKWSRFHSEKSDPEYAKNQLTNCVYLEDSEITIDGVRFYGSPWQPEFEDWAFNVKSQAAIKKYWDDIPIGVDVLITHGPPKGHGGKTMRRRDDVGCPVLLDTILNRVKPALHVSGHIHEGYGVSRQGDIYFVNASSMNYRYDLVNQPVVVDLIKESNN